MESTQQIVQVINPSYNINRHKHIKALTAENNMACAAACSCTLLSWDFLGSSHRVKWLPVEYAPISNNHQKLSQVGHYPWAQAPL